MKIITTPWKNELLELAENSKHSIRITSPFVKTDICAEISNSINPHVQFDLITSFKLINIYSGSLDLEGLEVILSRNGRVKTNPRVHAKIYLFDEEKAVVTSGNLTNGGLVSNYEYGFFIDDRNLIAQIAKDFERLFYHDSTGTVKQDYIDIVRNILPDITLANGSRYRNKNVESLSEPFNLLELPEDSLVQSLTGWKREIFKCVTTIPSQIFTLSQINQYEPHLKKQYPSNNHITDKIRQQLQILRDLGFIEFLGKGKYRKLWQSNRLM